MIRKTAADLQVGDTFYRETYKPPTPGVDWKYTVLRLQRVPQRDFFGKLSERVEVSCENHLLGPAQLSLGIEETVWLTEPDPPRPPDRSSGRGLGWRFRRHD
ncbi:MAG: hypothetical protein AB1673_03225 [Actinomycetota bacterium]